MGSFRGRSGRRSSRFHPHGPFRGNSGRGGVSPLFDFYPGDPERLPSIDNLSPELTINGITETPLFRYRGKDATSSSWPAWTYGETLTAQGSGGTFAADSPLLGVNDEAFKGAGTRWFKHAASTTYGDLGTDDFVIEVIFLAGTITNGGIASKRGTGAFWHTHGSPSQLSLSVNDGVTGATAATAASTLVANSVYHGIIFADRSGSAQWYLNGAASGSATAISTIGSLSGSSGLALNARIDNGTDINDGSLLYVAAWKRANWLDTHLQATVAKERFSRLTAIWPRVAAGTAAPSTITRASTGTLRKTTSGVITLFTAGANWPRVEKTSAITGYLSETSVANLCLQSEDIATSWTELTVADTQSLNAIAAPNGETTADGNIADATDGDHGFTQAVTLTAATYTFSVFAKAGNKNWLYLSDNTVANATCYFNLASGVVGTAGAGVSGTHIEAYGNGWYRCGISFTGTVAAHTLAMQTADADGDKTVTGDAATVNTYFWGMQCELNAYPSSYIRTTTATVTRVADALGYDSAGNANTASGSVVVAALRPAHSQDNRAALIRNTGGTDFIMLRHSIAAAPKGELLASSGGVTVADIDGTTTVSAARNVLAGSWQVNDFHLYVNGSEEGTPDVSGAVPTALNVIGIGGSGAGGNNFNGLIERCRIFARPGVKL